MRKINRLTPLRVTGVMLNRLIPQDNSGMSKPTSINAAARHEQNLTEARVRNTRRLNRQPRPQHYAKKDEAARDLNRNIERRCDICARKIKGRTIHIDHCHSTGIVRGLLCQRCNTALGMFGDSTFMLGRAIAYLARSAWRRAA